jgi:hypothetical protein
MKSQGRGWLLLVCALVLGGARDARAQFPEVVITRAHQHGYEARVGTEMMVILKQYMVDSIAVWHPELKLLRAENQKLRRMIDEYVKADSTLTKARGDANAYVTALEQQLAGYRELAEGYKKLNAPRTLSIEGGAGISGKDTKPALMVGVGLQRMRFWTLLQENNVGGFLGVNFPLF